LKEQGELPKGTAAGKHPFTFSISKNLNCMAGQREEQVIKAPIPYKKNMLP